jgi:hypothetical protein
MGSQKKIVQKKRKKNQRELKKREWNNKIQQRKDFPNFEFTSEDKIPESLLIKLKKITTEIIDSSDLDHATRKALEQHRSGNFDVFQEYQKLDSHPSNILGQLIFDKFINESGGENELRAFDFTINLIPYPSRGLIRITCRSLDEPFKSHYCSPKRHKIDYEGEQKAVVFGKHTLDRINERLMTARNSYAEKGFAFAIPYNLKYFDLIKIANGQDAIRIWNWCDPKCFLGELFAELLHAGEIRKTQDNRYFFEVDGSLCYYVVGYCPVMVDEAHPDYLICKSLLLPGMEGTPEHTAFIKSKRRISTIERETFNKRVKKLTFESLLKTRDFSLIRELHSWVPQVKPIREEVYDLSTDKALPELYQSLPSQRSV